MLEFIITIFSYVLEYLPWIIYMLCTPRIIHFFQMEGYKTSDYTRWLGRNMKTAFGPGIKQLLACGAIGLISVLINGLVGTKFLLTNVEIQFLTLVEMLATFTVYTVVNFAQIKKDINDRKNAKKKLVYTARVKRLIAWNFVLFILLYASFIVPSLYSYDGIIDLALLNVLTYMNTTMTLVYCSVFIALIPFNVLLANYLAWPTETGINDRFIKQAKRKLKKREYKNLIRIGITGSYGKTSTKFILKTILSEKYNVLATPESYNTTMGNVRVIREQLKTEHDVFISEMGARYRRDIAEICDFVRPQYSIITSIGPQHLETFKSIDNIIKTKADIINTMEPDGVVFLPKDNEHCKKLYNKENREKYSYSLKSKDADVYAQNIVLDENGSNFVAITSIGKINCSTKLLGEHNIENILGCIAIAVKLGLSVEQIEAGVKKIEPVPHRLQILNNNNGTIVIDDAFNSNPVGAKMAIDVLGKFKGRKIVITPGMVELGKEEKNENRKFGKHMASVVDIAILVGQKRSEPIVEGLRQGKFNEMNIFVVQDLKAATAKLAEISQVGDVILFENDLPDSYNE